MKIGKFAKQNDISIDTIRHYIDIGLLAPPKKGTQYDFDDNCQHKLNEIIYYKDLAFSLSEIKNIFIHKSLGNKNSKSYEDIFNDKLNNIEQSITQLNTAKHEVSNILNNLSNDNNSKNNTTPIYGVTLSALPLLKCTKCGGALSIANASISNNKITDGLLECSCGSQYLIKSGILYINIQPASDEITLERYIDDYIENTDDSFLCNIYKSLEFAASKIDKDITNEKIIVELGSGSGYFLRNMINNLSDNAIYFAIDHDDKRHKFIKNMLGKSKINKNIVFVCADFLNIPLLDKSADIIIDGSGSTNYAFEHKDFLLELIDNLAKENSLLLASFILFKNFAPKSYIPLEFRSNFKLECIKEKLNFLNYKTQSYILSDEVKKAGKYEDFFIEGEKVFVYTINAQKTSC